MNTTEKALKQAYDYFSSNNMKHTPGPWKVIGNPFNDEIIKVLAPFGVEIADASCIDFESDKTESDKEKNERLANAKLIAAAPELLEVLKFIASGTYTSVEYIKHVAELAIKKATT